MRSIRGSKTYRILLIFALAISLFTLIRFGGRVLSRSQTILTNDFGQIWAAGNLNLHGGNPYDPESIQGIKNILAQTNYEPPMVAVLYSPPWFIPLAMLFGAIPYLPGRFIWLVLSIIALMVSARILWEIYQESPQKRWVAWLVLFSFGPVYLVLSQGQTTVWMLVGLTGFLMVSGDSRKDWLTGVFIYLASIKPQVIILFWPALLFWVVSQRRWKVISSTAIILTATTAISMLFNPDLLGQYLKIIQGYSPLAWFTPTFGAYLRLAFGLEKFWLQYVPTAIGMAWLLYYWYKKREKWDWTETLPVILVMSILTSPYSWTYDQVVMLVALIPAWVGLVNSRRSGKWYVTIGVYFLINLSFLILHRQFTDDVFIWFAPAMGLWILSTKRIFPIAVHFQEPSV